MAQDPSDAYNEVAAQLAPDGATRSQMFGMPSLKVGGKAFAGQFRDVMVFKLGGPPHADALAVEGAHLFDPGMGRPMKEWVQLPATRADRWVEFARHAMAYVSSKS